ncbi:hypothetical protein BCAR13_1050029 [Paraburkholderia caribensis]|nr:hypothetical protein BCAR13_1050029 [Paraburkholderia caribensis]
MALTVQLAFDVGMQAAPLAVARVFEGADFGQFRHITEQRRAALAQYVLEEHALVASVAMEGFHRFNPFYVDVVVQRAETSGRRAVRRLICGGGRGNLDARGVPAIFMPLRYNVVGLAHIACARPAACAVLVRVVGRVACVPWLSKTVEHPSKHGAAT